MEPILEKEKEQPQENALETVAPPTQEELEAVEDQADIARREPFNVIKIVFTFEDYRPMIFWINRQLSTEQKAAREQFYGLTNKEQAEKVVEYRIGEIAAQLSRAPKNVPGVSDAEDYKTAFIEFFSQNPEFMGWLWGKYQDKLYPKELFSNFSAL